MLSTYSQLPIRARLVLGAAILDGLRRGEKRWACLPGSREITADAARVIVDYELDQLERAQALVDEQADLRELIRICCLMDPRPDRPTGQRKDTSC